MATWETISKRPGVTRYWVVRGTISGAEGETPISVKWGTLEVRQPGAFVDDRIDDRLAEPPSAFAVGLPGASGAPPERTSTVLVLNNQDGALDTYLVGGSTPATEFTSYNLYAFTGQISEGVVDSDGTTYEREWSPTLVTAGPITHRDGFITLPLASRDDRILGRSKKMITVRTLRDGTSFGSGDLVGNWEADITTGATAFNVAMTEVDESKIDTPIPWAYGRATIPLVRINADDADPAWFLAWCGTEINNISLASSWDVFGRKDGVVERIDFDITHAMLTFATEVDVDDEDGNTFRVWVMGARLGNLAEEYSEFWIVPDSFNLCGVAESTTCSAAKVIELLVTDHSEAGAAGIDATTFAAADAALQSSSGAVGGLFGDGATIAEVLHYIGIPWQIGMEIGTDDTLRIYVPGWGSEDATLAAATLPTVTHADVYSADDQGRSTWEEMAPADAEDHGAPTTRVWIDWADDQKAMFPPGNRIAHAPGMTQVPLTTDVEVRIPGAWIYPETAATVLTHLSVQRTFATRQVAFQSHIWVAALGPMALLRVTHNIGLGYTRRLIRILRTTIMPGEASARIEAEDLGTYEAMRVGVLDSVDHWIVARGNGNSVEMTVAGGSTQINASGATFDSAMVGCSIWFPNAADVRDRERKIAGYISTTSVVADRSFNTAASHKASSPADPIDEPWMILENHTTAGGYGFRPDKIRVCEEVTGLFDNSDAGQQFTLR